MIAHNSSPKISVPEKRHRAAALHNLAEAAAREKARERLGVRQPYAAFITSLCFALYQLAFAADAPSASRAEHTDDSFPVLIQVDASQTKGEFKPVWRFFGADEPNYATMKNGKKLISELGALANSRLRFGPPPNKIYFRAHNLLTSGDGTAAFKWGSTGAYDEDSAGKPIYNWKILDEIFDTYHEWHVKPYVEIGFMPKALSIKPEPYQHHWGPRNRYDEIFTGWAYPPKDYKKWGDLAYEWTKHCVEKYGRAEVESWYWEVWNEPNIGYWKGTPEEFLKLHDYAIDGVRRALPTARVGGADTAGSGGRFTRQFLEHCLNGTNFATGKIGTPLDFISFHAKGSPTYTNDHVRMGMANQLRTIEDGFRIIASYPELKDKPIVIGESDPEGCAACQGPQLAYRNGTMYSSYTAACFARKYDLAEKYGVNLDGALTWAFEFEDQPYFAGFRALASNGLDKPVLNVFRMFSQMHGRRLAVESDHAIALEEILKNGVRSQPDVSGLASLYVAGSPATGYPERPETTLSILLWHYHDDDVTGPPADIRLSITGLHGTRDATFSQCRIDEDHSNAFGAWKRMGSPQQPTPEQYAQLEKAGQLTRLGAEENVAVENGHATIRVTLPRQAVSLLRLTW
jgi:xylan 1,4-beta-xylosidase